MPYSSRFHSNLSIPLLLFYFALASLLKRLSIQYVYERNFLSSPVFQSGCKTKTSFCFLQEKLEIFFWSFFFASSFRFSLPVSQGTFRVLRGANVKSFFFSRKLFLIFFFRKSLSSNMVKLPECLRAFFAVAGAKVEPFSAFPMLLPGFFWSFFGLFLNALVTACLHFMIFRIRVGFFFLIMLFRHFLRAAAFRF